MLDVLKREDLYHPQLLFRALDVKHLPKALKHGTDRFGFVPADIHFKDKEEYQNSIEASTEEEMRSYVQTSLPIGTPFILIEDTEIETPAVLVYDGRQFLSSNKGKPPSSYGYTFKEPDKKLEALVCTFAVHMPR